MKAPPVASAALAALMLLFVPATALNLFQYKTEVVKGECCEDDNYFFSVL